MAASVQIVLWIFILVVLVALFPYKSNYSRESVESWIAMTLIFEAMVSLVSPFTMMKIEFNKSFAAMKIGPFCYKKLNYTDIKHIKTFKISSGQYLLDLIFFSEKQLRQEDAEKCFNKNGDFRKEKLLFCSYPQKGMDELLQSLFPELYDGEKQN